MKIILDRAQEFESRGRKISLGEVLDFYADAEESKEGSPLVNEEGEADLSQIVAKLAAKAYWRDLALSQDNARKAAKLAPSKVYRAQLGGEAQAPLEAAREEAAKLAGITLAAPKAPKAPKVEPLEAAVAKELDKPAKEKKTPKAKPAKTDLAPLATNAKVEAPKAIVTPQLPPPAPVAMSAASKAAGISPARLAELKAKEAARRAAKHAKPAS